MNDIAHQKMVQEMVKGKFGRKKSLESSTAVLYPSSSEREYQRITNAYVKELNKIIKRHLPTIKDAYMRDKRGDARFDDLSDLRQTVGSEFSQMAQELEKALAGIDLKALLGKVSGSVKSSTLREWKRAVKQTLGVDILNDYYQGDFYDQIVRQWIDENVSKISMIPKDELFKMKQVMLDGFENGRSLTDITNDLQSEYSMTKHRAQMYARDQLSTLNSEITKQQHQSAGVKRYKWSTSLDSRVRECHSELEGTIHDWDDPPEMWYETKSSGTVYTGRRCHPGEDYCCRCVAIPVFDFDTVDVPVGNNDEDNPWE